MSHLSGSNARMDPAFAHIFARLFDVVKSEESYVDSIATDKSKGANSFMTKKKQKRGQRTFSRRHLDGTTPTKGPALIRNISSFRSSQVKDGMTWDPVACMWRGNEQDLNRFRTPKPALIGPHAPTTSAAQVTPQAVVGAQGAPVSATQPIGPGKMVFDPVTLKWQGNEEDDTIFDGITMTQSDESATVQKDFLVLGSHMRTFNKSESDHDAQLAGWMRHCDIATNRAFHCNVIRQMAIEKVIADLTRPPLQSAESADSMSANADQGTNGAAQDATQKKNVEDISDGFGDVPEQLTIVPFNVKAPGTPTDDLLAFDSPQSPRRQMRTPQPLQLYRQATTAAAAAARAASASSSPSPQPGEPAKPKAVPIADLPMDDLDVPDAPLVLVADQYYFPSPAIKLRTPNVESGDAFADGFGDEEPKPLALKQRAPAEPEPGFLEESEEKGRGAVVAAASTSAAPQNESEDASSDSMIVGSDEDVDLEGVLFGPSAELRRRGPFNDGVEDDIDGLAVPEPGERLVLRLPLADAAPAEKYPAPKSSGRSDTSGIVMPGDVDLVARKKESTAPTK
eukprot:m51a1_g5686 hypothetical protein (567) ;mRNA; r:985616-987922